MSTMEADSTRLAKIARSEVVAAWQRIIVILGGVLVAPVVLGIIGWMAITLTGIDASNEQVKGLIEQRSLELKIEIKGVSTEVSDIKERVSRLETVNDRHR